MKSVLIIDDDREFRGALAACLAEQGWRVFEAEDGEIGLRLAVQHRPQVVLCDLLMPRCNGFQVCRTLRHGKERLPGTKIIVMTGSAYATDRLNALEAGADEYLVKPVQPRELFSLMDGAICGAVSSESPEPPAATAAQSASGVWLRFWGVRGSIPTPGPATAFYGGNTACVELRADGELIVLDAGTGIRPLGVALRDEFVEQPIGMTILITHSHWDHIQGFPFFQPAYEPNNRIRILGFEGARQGLESTLLGQMESPYFPISMRQMPGNIEIQELKEMEFEIGAVRVRAEFVNHPGVCVGYRLLTSGGAVCYLPDVELTPWLDGSKANGSPANDNEHVRSQQSKMVQFVQDAEVLIIDSQYDAVEYGQHQGWGHSSLEDTIALAARANVRRVFLFHHDPDHNDETVSRFVARARELAATLNPNLQVEAAREGLEVVLVPARKATE